jgi:hypothetical protein
MASPKEIEDVVRDVAGAKFPGTRIDRVAVEPGIASTGEDAVRILVVFADPVNNHLAIVGGFLDALTDIWTRLEQMGEQRMPILRYAAAHELEPHADSES